MTLTKYYELFKAKKQERRHNLRIATIFSYGVNEDDKDANGIIIEEDTFTLAAEPLNIYQTQHSRDILESCIADYNALYGTSFTTKDSHSFYLYYNDIAKRVKEKQIDLLLVVNMFLTGFDSKTLNTLYVDKNLKYHGLIQAFSRTNRILNDLISETEQLAFVQAFRDLMRINNILTSFADFNPEHIDMDLQSFEDYKSKYLDLYESTKGPSTEKVSILDDVDFELELIHRDEVNVAYILELLAKLTGTDEKTRQQQQKQISDLIDGTVQLRSKKELIEKFIAENVPYIAKTDNVTEQFGKFWNKERIDAFQKLVSEENLKPAELQAVIENYLYSEREPLRDEIVNTLEEKSKLLERKTKIERVLGKIVSYVNTFFDGVEEVV